jgi:hypothetical protein
MAVKLSDLTKQARVIYIDIGASEPLEVEYRVQAYTPEVEYEILNAESRPAGTLARILGKLIVRWSLVDDDGNMYPLDESHTAKLPLQLMITIFSKIAEDMRPNSMNAGG